MPRIPDLNDPRYLDEIGWFLSREQELSAANGSSYVEERLAYSRLFLDEVLRFCQQDPAWLADKTVLSVGAGCTGDLAVWPAAVKIAVDPLLYAYQQLGMLVADVSGTPPTVYLSVSAEEIPLLDGCVDLLVCRNALDHMTDPVPALDEMARVLKSEGLFFLSVDLGGEPTPDEPSVFSRESLSSLLREHFDVLSQTDDNPPHSPYRSSSLRILSRKRPRAAARILDKAALLAGYVAQIKR